MRNIVGTTKVSSPSRQGSGSGAVEGASAKGESSAGSVRSHSLWGASWVASGASGLEDDKLSVGSGMAEGGGALAPRAGAEGVGDMLTG